MIDKLVRLILPGLFVQKGIGFATAAGLGGAVLGALDDNERSQTTAAQFPSFLRKPARETLGRGVDAARNMEFIPFTPEQNQSLGFQTDFANRLQPATQGLDPVGTIGAAGDLTRRTLRGDFLSPDSNPFLQENLDLLGRSVSTAFNRDVLPQLGSAAQRAGAFGGARQGLAEARGADEVTENIADQQSRMLLANLGRERNLQQGALQMAPRVSSAALQMGLTPAEILGNVGNLRRGMAQEEQGFDFGREQAIAEFIQQLNPGSTQTTTNSPPSTAVRALQGGVGGLQMANLWRNVFDEPPASGGARLGIREAGGFG